METSRLNALIQEQVKKQYPDGYKPTIAQSALSKMSPRSQGEEAFWFQINHASNLPLPEREVCVVPKRRWRFDFVWRYKKLIFEIEGGHWMAYGRHTFGSGFENDIRKYEAARRLGYQVCRYTTQMVLNGEALRDAQELLS